MSKRFPIQWEYDRDNKAETGCRMAYFPAGSVPWEVAEKAYAKYSALYGTSQSLERLAERAGFGHWEMDDLHGPGWRETFIPSERQRRDEYGRIDMSKLPKDFTLVRD